MGNPFAIYELAPGKGCTGEGWARVDQQGFVCLRDTEASRRRGKDLPALAKGRVVPFIYGKPRADRAGNLLAPVPRYRSGDALLRGDAPLDHLEAHHQYAFIESRRVEGGVVLLDRSGWRLGCQRACRGAACCCGACCWWGFWCWAAWRCR